MRSIKKIHQANYHPIGDLLTYSPLPSYTLDKIDPFLFLNHHGPQVYPPNNKGLPFGPHPHRGMETVTIIIDGDISHKDSNGNESVIEAGGVQWMTAGRGLIHAEVSSEKFKKQGGKLEILQLWINLPARSKMIEPKYEGLQRDKIPVLEVEEGVKMQLISGQYQDTKGAFEIHSDVFLSLVHLSSNSQLKLRVARERNVFFYIIRGTLKVNDENIPQLHLVEFHNDEEVMAIEATEEATLLFGHANPLNEPVVARGPFVMNTEEEILEAYHDYKEGKFGTWNS